MTPTRSRPQSGQGWGYTNLGAGRLGLVDQAVTWVAGGEKAVATVQDWLMFLEDCQKFMTEKKQKRTEENRRNEEFMKLKFNLWITEEQGLHLKD